MITRSDRQKKESRARRRHKFSRYSVIGDLFLIVVLLFALVVLFVLIRGRIEGNAPHLAGYRFYTLSAESMHRGPGSGSLVIVDPAAPEQLSAGDLIVAYLPGDDKRVVACRIVEVDPERGSFLTDGGVHGEPVETAAASVSGRVARFVPFAGYILDFVQKPAGVILLVIMPALLIIVLQLRKLGREDGTKAGKSGDENNSPGALPGSDCLMR